MKPSNTPNDLVGIETVVKVVVRVVVRVGLGLWSALALGLGL